MITESVLSAFAELLGSLVGLVPSTDPPPWLSDGGGLLGAIWEYGAGLGAWVPWTTVSVVFSAIIMCIGLGLAIKFVRIVLSFFTAGGGSAA